MVDSSWQSTVSQLSSLSIATSRAMASSLTNVSLDGHYQAQVNAPFQRNEALNDALNDATRDFMVSQQQPQGEVTGRHFFPGPANVTPPYGDAFSQNAHSQHPPRYQSHHQSMYPHHHHQSSPYGPLLGDWPPAPFPQTRAYFAGFPSNDFQAVQHHHPHAPFYGNALPPMTPDSPVSLVPTSPLTASPALSFPGPASHTSGFSFSNVSGSFPFRSSSASDRTMSPPESANTYATAQHNGNQSSQQPGLTLRQKYSQVLGQTPVEPSPPSSSSLKVEPINETITIKQEEPYLPKFSCPLARQATSQGKESCPKSSWTESLEPAQWRAPKSPVFKATSLKTRTKDKYRVVYSEQQRVHLEASFLTNRYIAIHDKAILAARLGLSERQVKIWYQNRRAKDRKHLQRAPKEGEGDPSSPAEASKVTTTRLPDSTCEPFWEGAKEHSSQVCTTFTYFPHFADSVPAE